MNIIVGLLIILLVLFMCFVGYSISIKKAKRAVNEICNMADGLSIDMDSLSDEMFELKCQIARLSDALYADEDKSEDVEETDTEETV